MDCIYFVFETSLLFVCLPVSLFCLGFIGLGGLHGGHFVFAVCCCCALCCCCAGIIVSTVSSVSCPSDAGWCDTGLFAIGQQLGQWDCSIQVMMSSDSSLLLLSHWLSSVLVVYSSCGCTTHFLFHEACREVRHHAVLYSFWDLVYMVEIEPYTFETYWLLLLPCPCTTPTKSVDQTVSHSTFWPVSCCADPLTNGGESLVWHL